MGNPLQDRAVLSVLCRHHIGYHLWNAASLRCGAAHAFYSSRPPFAKGASERGGIRQLADSSTVLEHGDAETMLKVVEGKSRGNFAGMLGKFLTLDADPGGRRIAENQGGSGINVEALTPAVP